ncbi:DUF4440 domain-containing protein [Zeaxanthinibacter enoshimensis]|uniref:YybH family protein n=1 Tax=Zeaxanthinibacter enoshimensis TaxID=392009 RepID=UPI003567DF65
MKQLWFLLLCCLVLSSCAEEKETEQAVDLEAEKEALMEASRDWANSTTNEEYLSYWHEDAILLPQGRPALRGHDEIMAMLKETDSIPGWSVDWEPYEAHISESGDMGYLLERSLFTWNDSTGQLQKNYMNAVTIWKKQPDGSWKNVVDINTSDPTMTSIR